MKMLHIQYKQDTGKSPTEDYIEYMEGFENLPEWLQMKLKMYLPEELPDSEYIKWLEDKFENLQKKYIDACAEAAGYKRKLAPFLGKQS